ncbi:MAG: S26 family signal peptidase [Candidatus Omnitrophota bacterium]
MACPHCGFDNPEGSIRCARCQSILDASGISQIYPGRSHIPPSQRVRSAYWQARKYRVQKKFQNAYKLRTVSSFFVPGLGQFLAGEKRKGILIFLSCIFLLLLGWPFRGGFPANLLLSILLSIHGYSVLDTLRHHLLTVSLVNRVLLSILITGSLFIYYLAAERIPAEIYHFQIRRIDSDLLQPILQRNDIIIITETAHLHQKPQRGDLIAFGTMRSLTIPERLRQTNEAIIFSGQSTIGSLIGFPEEEIMVHDERIFVNGKPLEHEMWRFSLSGIPEGYQVKVPSNSYLALGGFSIQGGGPTSDLVIIPEHLVLGKVARVLKPLFLIRNPCRV